MTFVICFISVVFHIRRIAKNHCLSGKRRTTVKLYWPLFAVENKKNKNFALNEKKNSPNKTKIVFSHKKITVSLFSLRKCKKEEVVFLTQKIKISFPHSRSANYFKKFVWMLYWALHHLLSKSTIDKQENFQVQITLQSYTRYDL